MTGLVVLVGPADLTIGYHNYIFHLFFTVLTIQTIRFGEQLILMKEKV